MQQKDSWLLPEGIEETLPAEAKHLEALRNKLLVAGYYFNRDKATEACAQLAESLKRIDTKNAPDANDYVTGTATGELTNQINALRADKQCQ